MSVIKSFAVGNGEIRGDMFYIKHRSDYFTMIDCCLKDENKERIVDELMEESKGKGKISFISTHPDEDHIRKISYLDDKMGIMNFYCVENQAVKDRPTLSFERYCRLRDSDKANYIHKGYGRNWMEFPDDERGGGPGISILWPDTKNEEFKKVLEGVKEGKSPNNLSPVIKYTLKDGAKVLWMGDLETDFMTKISGELENIEAHLLFAPHHGRGSGKVPNELLKKINPKLIIIGEAPSKNLHYYQGYHRITQNSAGDILFHCVKGKVHIYVSNPNYHVGFLRDEKDVEMIKGVHYIGTLLV